MQPHGNGIGEISVPTMTATGLPPIASWNTTKRVGLPELRGTYRFPRRIRCIVNQPVKMLSRRLQSGLIGHGIPKFVYLAWDSTRTKLERNLPSVAAR
jgi:hypothetical protein